MKINYIEPTAGPAVQDHVQAINLLLVVDFEDLKN
jgi:hypothetical protein